MGRVCYIMALLPPLLPRPLCHQIPVPALTPSASRWSWDPEEERRRQEKWQKEQDRLLQVSRQRFGWL